MTIKLEWRVAPVATGRYRSFHRRGWPVAWYKDSGKPCAFLYCADEYRPADVREGMHGPIEIVVCHHQHHDRGNSWVRIKLRKQAANIGEAKLIVREFLKEHPHFAPAAQK